MNNNQHTPAEILTVLVRLGREAEGRRRQAEKNIARIDTRFTYGKGCKAMSTTEYAAHIRSRCANEHVSANAGAEVGAYAAAALELSLCRHDEFLSMIGALAPEIPWEVG